MSNLVRDLRVEAQYGSKVYEVWPTKLLLSAAQRIDQLEAVLLSVKKEAAVGSEFNRNGSDCHNFFARIGQMCMKALK